MNLNIEKDNINGIYLGDKKAVLSEEIDTITYYYELNSKQEIKTLSVRLCNCFIFKGEKIRFNNFKNMLIKYHGIEGIEGTYYFIDLNLIVWIDIEKQIFNEILLYADEMKDFYNQCYNSDIIQGKKLNEKLDENLFFSPFIGLSSFKFGLDINNLCFIEDYEYMIDKYYINELEYALRFDNMLLSQITIYRRFFKGVILYNNFDLNKKSDLECLIDSCFKIERRGYWVLPEIGITISYDFEELFFFNKELLEFWKMIHRPITSW